jgi:AraC-like DNA-binding protein
LIIYTHSPKKFTPYFKENQFRDYGALLNSMLRTSPETIESIRLHRVAVVRPFIQFLADIGAPVEHGIQQAGLPFEALENVNNYVPSQRFLAFVVDMARSQGIEDLGFQVGQKHGADSADPKLTRLLHQSPTLYHGLSKAGQMINKTVSRSRMGFLLPPLSEHAYFYHRPSCDIRNPACNQISWFGLMAIIDMVRVFTGPRWRPTEIGLMTHRAPCRHIREQFPGTCIRISPQYSYITLEKALLSLPPLPHVAATPASSPLHYESLPNNFIHSLKQVLLTYIQEGDLSIEFAAELCNTSKRSLQRRLAEMGTRYSEVLDQARFDVASRMLQDPDMKVTNVAHLLGYSDPTHFSRAFRRIAGIGPRAYRQAYLH